MALTSNDILILIQEGMGKAISEINGVERAIEDIRRSFGRLGTSISRAGAELAEMAVLGTRAAEETSNKWKEMWMALDSNEMKRKEKTHSARIKELEDARDKAVQNAIEKNEQIADIDKYYNRRIFEEEKKIMAERLKGVNTWVNIYTDVANRINKTFRDSLSHQKKDIEKDYKEKRELAEDDFHAGEISKAEYDKKIMELRRAEAAEKLELDREQAKRDKAFGIFTATIDTARAYVRALAELGPIAGKVAAIGIVAAGLAQVAAINATPEPFYAGGLIKGTPTGILAQIGEKNQDEVVLPLERGTDQIADKLIGALRTYQNSPAIEHHSHYHIGTLIADENGLKILERKLRPHRTAEDRRTGIKTV